MAVDLDSELFSTIFPSRFGSQVSNHDMVVSLVVTIFQLIIKFFFLIMMSSTRVVVVVVVVIITSVIMTDLLLLISFPGLANSLEFKDIAF